MKYWQVGIILAVLAVCGYAIITHPPGAFAVRQQGEHTPAPTSAPRDITLRFVGDIMLSRSVGDTMRVLNDWRWPFALIASTTRSADLIFGNLETTISSRGFASGCGFCFRADPRAAESLKFAGFDVVSIANNHIMDYGLVALEDTIALLASHSISSVGGGRTLQDARGPVIRTVRDTRIAYLAYTDMLPASKRATATSAGVNLYDADAMVEDISRARSLADIVVVSFHTGTEYEPKHNALQERIYHGAIDAGADLVIGHHPHVVQELERYKNGWIAYSLGNFVFDQNWSDATRRGAMLDVIVRDNKIISVASRAIDISRQYQPSLH